MKRPSWGFAILLLILITLPILEVWVLLQVGQQIGLLPTVLILIGEAILGGWLMRREGQRAWTALNTTFASGKLPAGELADAALILVGGVLLMLPGFITDIFGFLFLLPFTRPIARHILAFFVARRMNRLGLVPQSAGSAPGTGTVIEGEVVPNATQPPSQPVIIRGEIDHSS